MDLGVNAEKREGNGLTIGSEGLDGSVWWCYCFKGLVKIDYFCGYRFFVHLAEGISGVRHALPFLLNPILTHGYRAISTIFSTFFP